MSNLIITIVFDIYNILNKNLYFYIVWFVHILWLVQAAVCDGSDHW